MEPRRPALHRHAAAAAGHLDAATPGLPTRGFRDTMTLRALLVVCALLVLPWLSTSARAQSCSSGTTAALDFGTIAGNPTVQTDVTGTLSLTCTGSANQAL